MKIQGLLQWGMVLILAGSLIKCNRDPCGGLQKDSEGILKDNLLTNQEREEFMGRLQKASSCSFFGKDSCELETYLSVQKPGLKIEAPTCSRLIPQLKVYMENSDSMDGYLRGNTDFKDSLTHLIVRLKSQASRVEYFFIHSGMVEVKLPLEGFVKEISLNGNSAYIRNKSSTFGSDLNSLFKKIIQSLNKEDLAVFITDGIYSIQESSNIQNELMSSQNFTMNTFIEGITDKSISTVVLQYESTFEGSYYDMYHNPHSIKAKKPFYIFLIGNKNVLDALWIEKYPEIKKYSKLKNETFYQNIQSKSIRTMVLSNYKRSGNRKIVDRYRGIIQNISLGTEKKFQISLVVDLEAYKGYEKTIEDVSNYKIPNYCSLELEKFENASLETNDRVFLKKFTGIPTHIFTLTCDQSILAEEKVSIALLKKSNEWIKQSSLDSDVVPHTWSAFKTFGLENLILGISDAYREFSSGEFFFVVPIQIER